MRVKLFVTVVSSGEDHSRAAKFESQVNQWLENNPEVEVQDVTLSTNFYDFNISIVCMVFYDVPAVDN
jgi:hypothetical protein